MSFHAVSAAFSYAGTSAEKLVLLSLANYADKHNVCWPGRERLVKDTGLSSATLWRTIKALEEKGYLQQQRRKSRTNKYRINVWKLNAESDHLEANRPSEDGFDHFPEEPQAIENNGSSHDEISTFHDETTTVHGETTLISPLNANLSPNLSKNLRARKTQRGEGKRNKISPAELLQRCVSSAKLGHDVRYRGKVWVPETFLSTFASS